jgi:hypothetical protein
VTVSTQHRAGAAEEGRVPEVVAILHNPVEELALIGNHAELVEIPLEWIGRVEVMRRLQHSQLGVAHEPSQRDLKEAARGHVIAVEDRDKRRVETLERAIDVARLGMLVVVARHVADASLFGEGAKLFAVAIVEDVDVQLIGWPVDVHRRERRVANHAQRLVIGGDQEIHRRPVLGIIRQRNRRPAQRPDRLHVAEEEDDEGVALRGDEDPDEKCIHKGPA